MAAIAVNPKVLIWARDSMRLTQSDAAAQLNMEQHKLAAHENGTPVNLGDLRAMASLYGVGLAVLAMPEPLEKEKLPEDFRTIDGRDASISPQTVLAVRRARNYQRWMSDIMDEEDGVAVEYSVPDAEPRDTPQILAKRERERFGVSAAQQIGIKSGLALRIWREKLEALGVSVYVLDFPRDDCRGFSLREAGNPVIVISKHEENEGAKIYTLFHEYAHILKNRPGLSDLNNFNSIEKYCNEFAAHFLMPIEALRLVLSMPETPTEIDWNLEKIRLAANRLHVSRQALALRLEQAGYAKRGLSERVKNLGYKNREKRPSKAAIPPAVKRLYEVGVAYANAALVAHDRGTLNDVEAFRALRLSPQHFGALRSRINERLPAYGKPRAIP